MDHAGINKYMLTLIRKIIPEWQGFSDEGVTVDRMTGITNETYKISHPSAKGALIYRKFGEASDNVFLDRKAEEFVYQHISEQRLGPKIYGYEDNVRIESFIPSKVLKTGQMLRPGHFENVSYALRRFHEMKPPANIDKRSLFEKIFFENPERIMEKCFKKLEANIFTEQERDDIEILKKWVSLEEINFLKEAVKVLEKQPLVFSHNDLLANNILLRDPDNKIIFIDYEYSCYNYRIFDIANYFNETQYDYDVEEEPYFGIIQGSEQKEKAKDRFIKLYCLAHGKQYPKFKQSLEGDIKMTQQEENMYKNLKKSLPLGEMLSNIMWGWWAIIVCKNPNIQFDYIRFAMLRYCNYMKVKKSGVWKM